ncbi:hypothetical protein FQZ97_1037150 [compost metagenome]
MLAIKLTGYVLATFPLIAYSAFRTTAVTCEAPSGLSLEKFLRNAAVTCISVPPPKLSTDLQTNA